MIRNLLIILILLVSANTKAQTNHKNIVISNILSDQRIVSYVSWPKTPYIDLGEDFFNNYPQELILCRGKSYIHVNGTGRLYKVDTSQNGIIITRVDSTTHFGYNYGAFSFCYNNNIYNIGGYGYWRMNGQLRIFNQDARQWDIVKLNKEIPILVGREEGLVWYDIKKGKIYTAYYSQTNEAVKAKGPVNEETVYDVMVLDLQKKEWSKIGKLRNEILNNLRTVKPITNSPWGQLITIEDKLAILDFKNNAVLSLDSKNKKYQSLIRAVFHNIFYFKDSTLFYSDNKVNLDSIVLHYSDFTTSNIQLYSSSLLSTELFINPNYYYIPLSIFVLIGLGVFYFLRKSKKIKKDGLTIKSVSETTSLVDKANGKSLFDELELQLLALIIRNSESGNTTTIEEQNKVLGLGKKSTDIQKKQRSDIIIGINKKYTFVTNLQEPLILKKRTEDDKRSFEYYIDYSKLEAVNLLISK